jgi:hypothetical protein
MDQKIWCHKQLIGLSESVLYTILISLQISLYDNCYEKE